MTDMEFNAAVKIGMLLNAFLIGKEQGRAMWRMDIGILRTKDTWAVGVTESGSVSMMTPDEARALAAAGLRCKDTFERVGFNVDTFATAFRSIADEVEAANASGLTVEDAQREAKREKIVTDLNCPPPAGRVH